MTNSKDSTTTGCFSSIFRRLLCAGGLPTHPSSDADNPKEQTTDDTSSSIKLLPPSPTRTTTPAGIVARLMGLDSFPNSPHSSTKVSLGKIMRKSKSVGSVDFLPNFDITKQPNLHTPYHRRIKTSVSFREVPITCLQTSHDNDLGKVDAIRKPEMGFTPIEEKSNNLNKKKKIKNTNKKIKGQSQSQTSKKVKSEEEEEEVSSVKLKCTRKRGVNAAKKKVVEDGFPEEQKKNKYKSRKRRYSHDHPLPKVGKHAHDARKGKKKTILLKRRESEYSEEYCIKVLVEVCRLTVEEMEVGDCWVDTKVVKNINLQEISYEISQEILQVLVYEMVHELYM